MRAAAAVVLLVGALLVLSSRSRDRIVLVALLVTLTVLPVRLVGLGEASDRWTVGTSSAVPALTAYAVVLWTICLYLLVSARRRPRGAGLVLPFLVALAVGTLVWPHEPNVLSGVLHLATTAAAWVVGLGLADRLASDAGTRRTLSITLLAVAVVLGVSVVVQTPLLGGAAETARASGLFSHPATIGKLAVLLLGLALPLTRSADRADRARATATVVVLVLSTAPTLSRANVVALLAALVVWTVLQPGGRARTWALLLAALVAVYPVVGSLAERFSVDREGGDRPELLDAGLRQISRSPWWGTGPNNYVPATAGHEPVVAATGYPVHNSLLLAVAELGLVCAALLLVPLVASAVTALRLVRRDGDAGLAARAFLAVAAGVVVVGATGWGLLQQPVTELLFLVAGVLHGTMRRATSEPGDADAVETVLGPRELVRPPGRAVRA
ncbi:O-antigen ligase family protein [Cellulosimicrobium sp. Marseille-Q8652]